MKICLGVISTSIATISACAQPATQWTFELQCRSSLNPNIPPFNLPPNSSLSSQSVALDDDGSVAIRVFLASGVATEGIFFGSDGIGGLVHEVNSSEPVYTSGLGNRNGRLALSYLLHPTLGAEVRSTNGTLLHSYPLGGPEGISGVSAISIAGDGAIGYRGSFGSGQKNLIEEFIGGVRNATQIANTFDGQYTFLFSPQINDARQMVGKVLPASGGQAVMRWNPGSPPTLIASTAATYNSFVNSTALAQNGTVAFTGRRSADSIWEVVRWDQGGTLTPVAQGGDMGIINGSLANFPPVVNSQGLVAFRPSDAQSTALYAGDGLGLVKLVEYGQPIETDIGTLTFGFDFGGGTGKQVMNGNIAINDAGQIAFAAFFNNGTIGVFVATPVVECAADYNGDGDVNFFDVQAFLSDFSMQNLTADLNEDGEWNFFDVQIFLQSFSDGCD
ncbi:MAG: hypothetical protein KF757_05960 [Phycisphaeraceae bacterium]|nr:hypothetical protein [Phycisphaeraceae bacterium]MCW5763718.1 hypothetical protein [Phycisphaeraceae bacterium]